LIGGSITADFTDTGLQENTTYTYEVSTVNGRGVESDKEKKGTGTY